jgi:bifunctional DNA-binding transcriptional regulator/antitoxin component of YhaV-PrlF toxin-antitoxin module
VKTVQEDKVFRTKVSQGYQVAVPAKLRKRYAIGVGDEVIWILEGDEVKAQFAKRPSLESIAAIGQSAGKKEDAVELKRKVQRGEV